MQTIVEMPEFQKRSERLLSKSERISIINYLAKYPASGDIMQGTGGIRKLRWSAQGKGKSGGVRVIYYWVVADDQLRMLYAYPKSEQEDLTKDQLAVLRKVVEEWL